MVSEVISRTVAAGGSAADNAMTAPDPSRQNMTTGGRVGCDMPPVVMGGSGRSSASGSEFESFAEIDCVGCLALYDLELRRDDVDPLSPAGAGRGTRDHHGVFPDRHVADIERPVRLQRDAPRRAGALMHEPQTNLFPRRQCQRLAVGQDLPVEGIDRRTIKRL